MLKRFSVENFLSFRREQSLDLTAGSTKTHPSHFKDFDTVKVLKSAVIYGANASGKSNLIKAIRFARNVIVKGIRSQDSYRKHFRLCKENYNKGSSFEFEIEIDNTFYAYGFNLLLKDRIIKEEWLYLIGKKSPVLIFERNCDGINIGATLNNNKAIKDRFSIYIDDMKNQQDQLFVTEIAEKNLSFEELKPINDIFNWFEEKLIVIYPDDKFNGFRSINQDLIKNLTSYLRKFDTGVVSIETIDEDFDANFKNIPDELKTKIENDLQKNSISEVIVHSVGTDPQFLTIYKDSEGELKVRSLGFTHGDSFKDVFELKDESDGTRRLLDFIPLISKFSEDYTILIDEFDRSLHPKLTKKFFNVFLESQNKKSQLIVTTHESTLLDLDLLRRDELWFVEKNDDYSSELFSLNRFQVRYDRKVEKAYLNGRYGAVPLFDKFGLY